MDYSIAGWVGIWVRAMVRIMVSATVRVSKVLGLELVWGQDWG